LLQSLKKNQTSLSNNSNIILEDTSKKVRELLMDGYPRGRKEITGITTGSFSPVMQQEWFEARGVELSTERDGSVVAIHPEMAIASLENHETMGVINVCTGAKVTQIEQTTCTDDDDNNNNKLLLTIRDASNDCNIRYEYYDCVVLATGCSFQGHQLAKSLGHSIVSPIRSMFGFPSSSQNKHQLLEGLTPGSHVTAPFCRVSFKTKVPGQKRPRVFKEEGPVDFGVTEKNSKGFVAGKAPLKLSSFAANELKNANYKGSIYIHFCPEIGLGQVEEIYTLLWKYRQDHPKELLTQKCPLEYREVDYDNYDFETDFFAVSVTECVPPEVWNNLCQMACGGVAITSNTKWGNLSPKKVRALADYIVGCPFEFQGRHDSSSSASAAFVNAGGVRLGELDMTKLSSKVCDGLFCCGQVLDTDGSSIGYNRMADWVTGYTAGVSAANYVMSSRSSEEDAPCC
jgi:predicted flavoprotein YhiN